MDIFDQYLFKELTTQYARQGLSLDDYEELYQRFCNMDYLPEVRPYIWTMRFFGLGTSPEKENVLSEIKASLSEGDFMLEGLYYDLLLSENSNDTDSYIHLSRMANKGYTDKYTKEKTHLKSINNLTVESECERNTSIQRLVHVLKAIASNMSNVVVDYISFECNSYNGIYFTADDIDYLNAKVYIKPFIGKKHIKVRSQIFLNNKSFSDPFYDEYDIDSNTRWIRTQGWGNDDFTCYENNIYKWVIEIDGKTTFSQEFRVYGGALNRIGPKVTNVKLFSAKSTKVLETDHNNYKTTFDRKTLEYVYFKFLINPPSEDMNVQVFIKVVYKEDNSVFRDKFFLQHLKANTVAFWKGIGFSNAGNWKCGLYEYTVHVGTGTIYKGMFTVY